MKDFFRNVAENNKRKLFDRTSDKIVNNAIATPFSSSTSFIRVVHFSLHARLHSATDPSVYALHEKC